jgi:hypothetical protein
MVEAFDANDEIARSLVDDVSTVNNNTSIEETIASEDPCPIQHETDGFLERQSEHSRLLTDDETSFRSWANQDNCRAIGDGNCSVNTGSTYEEPPFVLRTQDDHPAKDQEQQQVKQNDLEGSMDHRQYPNLTHTGSWRMGELKTDNSREMVGHAYACEMFLETQSMLQKTKTDMGELSRKLFEQTAETAKQSDSPTTTTNTALGNVHAILGVCGDKIDAVLIKLFNVPSEDAIDIRPNYSVSIDESLTRNTVRFPEHQKQNEKKDMEQTSEKNEKALNTYLVPVNQINGGGDDDDYEEVDDDASPTIHESESDELRNSESDVRDDLEDVLGDNNGDLGQALSNDSEDSVQRFKESLYAALEGKTEEEQDDRDPLPNEMVSTVLKKYEDHSKEKLIKTDLVVMHDAVGDDDTGDYSYSVSFSTIHKKHVVDLINKNLPATNRSGAIDLSHIDPMHEEKSEHNSLSEHSHKAAAKEKLAVATVAGTTDVASTKTTAYSNSFLFSPLDGDDEIEVNFRKRREKLRQMMADLNLTVIDGSKATADSEDREYGSYAGSGNTDITIGERRTAAATSTAEPAVTDLTMDDRGMDPIDLTMYDAIDLTMY